ncbi:MAG: PilZ domain-containing protein [Candidatus Omnitrophica bacterium]|nr:PilZ domain-containing protein [Candidatus Omnitrophota bacterium]
MDNKKKILTEERRKSKRIPQSLNVIRCSTKYLFERHYLSRDISEDGICLLTETKMEIGEIIELGIILSEDKEPLKTKGKILRRNETNDPKYPFLVGIEFVDIPKETHQEIKKHLKYYILKE